jgi:hypothetical protein
VVRRDLDEPDPHAVRVLDPHLVEAPGFAARLAHDARAALRELLVGLREGPDLHPEPDAVARAGAVAAAGHLEEPAAQEEHRAARELAVHGEAQDVSVERGGDVRIDRAQQDTAGENLHGSDPSAEVLRQ